MDFLFFANSILLQSIGWAIINSFWQVGLLWLSYKFITAANRKSAAVFKHNLSVVFLFASFLFFIVSIVETYLSITATYAASPLLFGSIYSINIKIICQYLPYITSFYLVLLFFYSIRFIVRYQKTISVRNGTLIKAPLELRMFTKSSTCNIGIKKQVQVWLSENIDVPSVIGFIKPLILLPVAAINYLSTDQLEAILLHELAHIKRNDYFINLFQFIIETILFFNPFAILLSNYAKKERENCCDDWVVNYQYNKQEYASALLQLEEQRRGHLILAVAATNKKELLLNRIKRLFNSEPKTSITTFQKLQIITISGILFFGIACLFLSPSSHLTEKRIQGIPSANISFKTKPVVLNYTRGNKEIVNAENNQPLKNTTTAFKRKMKLEKHIIHQPTIDYTLAEIPTGRLKTNNQFATTLTNVVYNEPTPVKQYYVKVEEEQSGKKQLNIYYFGIKKDNGKTIIEPIMILKKTTPKQEEIPVQINTDSTAKRITS